MRYDSKNASSSSTSVVQQCFIALGRLCGCTFGACRRILCGICNNNNNRRSTLPGLAYNTSPTNGATNGSSGNGSSGGMNHTTRRYTLFRLLVLICLLLGCCLYAYNFFVLPVGPLGVAPPAKRIQPLTLDNTDSDSMNNNRATPHASVVPPVAAPVAREPTLPVLTTPVTPATPIVVAAAVPPSSIDDESVVPPPPASPVVPASPTKVAPVAIPASPTVDESSTIVPVILPPSPATVTPTPQQHDNTPTTSDATVAVSDANADEEDSTKNGGKDALRVSAQRRAQLRQQLLDASKQSPRVSSSPSPRQTTPPVAVADKPTPTTPSATITPAAPTPVTPIVTPVAVPSPSTLAKPSIPTPTAATSVIDMSLASSMSRADLAALSNLVLIWDFGACGCTGWAAETINFVLGLYPLIPKLGIVAGDGCFCPGLAPHVLTTLHSLQKRPMSRWPMVDIFISHKPPTRYPKFPYDGLVKVQQRPHYVIGRSMTEVHQVAPAWKDRIHSMVDEVWLPSSASLPAFTNAGVRRDLLHIIPEPIDVSLYDINVEPLKLPGNARYKFLSVFKWEARKGWDNLLRAFLTEFTADDDVALYLQTYLYGDMYPHDSDGVMQRVREFASRLPLNATQRSLLPLKKIYALAEERDTRDMPRLYAACDAFVLPTRGEGWGLPLMEAMTMGLPTVATNWSGHLEFMHEDNSYLIPVDRLTNTTGREFDDGQMWAEASIPHLRTIMRSLYTDPAAGRVMGQRARASILSHYTIPHVTRTVTQRLLTIMSLHNITGSAHMPLKEEKKKVDTDAADAWIGNTNRRQQWAPNPATATKTTTTSTAVKPSAAVASPTPATPAVAVAAKASLSPSVPTVATGAPIVSTPTIPPVVAAETKDDVPQPIIVNKQSSLPPVTPSVKSSIVTPPVPPASLLQRPTSIIGTPSPSPSPSPTPAAATMPSPPDVSPSTSRVHAVRTLLPPPTREAAIALQMVVPVADLPTLASQNEIRRLGGLPTARGEIRRPNAASIVAHRPHIESSSLDDTIASAASPTTTTESSSQQQQQPTSVAATPIVTNDVPVST